MIKIPHDLKIMFLRHEGLTMIQEMVEMPTLQGQIVPVPQCMDARIDLDLSREPELLKVCEEWIETIETYFKTSYNACKIDIGEYVGLWPTDITDRIVHFRLDQFDSTRKSWKDWFIQEEVYTYASK